MDGMDAARFTSGNPDAASGEDGKRSASGKKERKSSTPEMPQVLRNLNNK
jgi:hypothetical protein